MKSLILLLILALSQTLCALQNRFAYGNDWDYQPILINGKEVAASCNASGGSQLIYQRYEPIKKFLDCYERPFTVLDLGANNGFFSLKIAEDFDASCVLVDDSERLTEICTLNTERNKIIHLKKKFKKEDIQELARREHFDVVLALFVLHHVDDWKSWLNALKQLADHVIIETPATDDPINSFTHTKQLARFLTSSPDALQIGSFPRGQGSYDHMLLFSHPKNMPCKRGISPSTFFLFNGSFPQKSYVQSIEAEMKKTGQAKAWVLQGIDYYWE